MLTGSPMLVFVEHTIFSTKFDAIATWDQFFQDRHNQGCNN